MYHSPPQRGLLKCYDNLQLRGHVFKATCAAELGAELGVTQCLLWLLLVVILASWSLVAMIMTMLMGTHQSLSAVVCARYRSVNHTYLVAAARRSVSRVSSASVSKASRVHTASKQSELCWTKSFALKYLILLCTALTKKIAARGRESYVT